jgi:hypothetical protein
MNADMLSRMEDGRDPSYTPFGKRRAPRMLDPREELWALRRDHIEWSCELVFRGESYGWEARVLNQGELFVSRRFIVKEPAVQWAADQKTEIERGWAQ